MSKSSIEWTQATWNPIVGCSIVSPGCTNCYAMKMATRIEGMNAEAYASGRKPNAPQYDGTTHNVNGNNVWTGKLARSSEKALLEPLRNRKPTTYFVNSMSDLFHEAVPDEWIDSVFAVMALAPQHTFQVLTKRAKRMREYCNTLGRHHEVDRVSLAMKAIHAEHGFGGSGAFYTMGEVGWHFKNIWLGVSTERQKEADERIPDLLATPAAVRFISAEPLLGPLDLDEVKFTLMPGYFGSALRWHHQPYADRNVSYPKLDWVIVGGESGPGSRPMHPDWARSLRDECLAAGVPFFFKQWGAFRPLTEIEKVTACGATLVYREAATQRGSQNAVYMLQVGKKRAGRELDGIIHDEMPGVFEGRRAIVDQLVSTAP